MEEGNVIEIDIPNRRVDLEVPGQAVEDRKKTWRIPDPSKLEKGTLLERYRRMVGPAICGATLE